MERDCKAYKALKNNKSKKSFERLHNIQKELQSSISEVRVPLHLTVRLSSSAQSPGAGNSNSCDSGCEYFAGSSSLQFLEDFLDAEDTLLDDFLLSIQFRKQAKHCIQFRSVANSL